MSLAAALGEASPPSSGRSSPVPRATRRAVEDGVYKADKALKRYAAAIERALASWEISPEEWADYIAFLSRLLKAIQLHPKDAQILPHSTAIATRLAQCLNPALPSGVHQKALDVYGYIFSSFGRNYISGHLHEFLPGLAAVLAFASLSVRPALYTLFEDYIAELPVSELRPALKSLILGLLPALEEENSEDFERAFNILSTFEETFGPRVDRNDSTKEIDGYFWQCLFLAVITSPSRRQGALNYFARKLPKLPPGTSGPRASKNPPQLTLEARCIVSPEPGLLMRCFACGLSDPQILVQRGFLDLLVTHVSLSSDILQTKIGNDDLDRVVSAAIQVLMRRDMSLNRRLWSWFLGPEPKDAASENQPASPEVQRKSFEQSRSNAQLRYFSDYGKSSLRRCILMMLQSSEQEPSQKARPFRICLSLMDRWEIGGMIIPEIFLPAMRALFEYTLVAPKRDVAEVVRSASLFFDGVEASLIWNCLIDTVQDVLDGTQPHEPAIKLFSWTVRTFNVKDEEMLSTHIPYTILFLLSTLDHQRLEHFAKKELLSLAILLFEMLPVRNFSGMKHGEHGSASNQDVAAIRSTILRYYRDDHRTSDKVSAPFDSNTMISLMIELSLSTFLSCLKAHDQEMVPKATNVLLALFNKAESIKQVARPQLQVGLLESFRSGQPHQVQIAFPIVQSVVALLSSLSGTDATSTQREQVLQIEPALTMMLWQCMSPQSPKYHVEAIRAFWQLEQVVFPHDTIIATLTRLVRESADSDVTSIERYRRFMVLWGHSIPAGSSKVGPGRRSSGASALTDVKRIQRALEVLEQPLLLVLETLSDTENDSFDALKAWLQSLGSLESVFVILFKNLTRAVSSVPLAMEATEHQQSRRRRDDLLEIEYNLRQFQVLLDHGSPWTWRCLSKTLVLDSKGAERAGLAFLADLCMGMLYTDFESSTSLHRQIISMLHLLLSGPASQELRELEIDVSLVEKLMVCITIPQQQTLQGRLLQLVQLALKLRLGNAPVTSDESQSRSSITPKRPSISLTSRPTTSNSSAVPNISPPPQLFKCISMGFASPNTRFHLEQWLVLLADVLPLFSDTIFTNLLPLVTCLCQELVKVHQQMIMLSQKSRHGAVTVPEAVAMSLLDALEMVLDRAYECLVAETANEPAVKDSEAKPSFLSNVTSGVFKAEGPPTRPSKSNSRLTVTLALQDAIRINLKMWLWAISSTETTNLDPASLATTAYHALKVRNKTRHLMEQIFSVEPLESLEVIIAHWCSAETEADATAAISVLHVMPVTRPKNAVPAILDALCSRTNSANVPTSRHSSLTLDISPSQVAAFFSAYLDSTEDDAIDELWPDCIAFLRDVLANPLPHRQVLPHLLSIMLLLSEKLGNTNFNEQRKMRRDLGDIFQRLLTATFTSLPYGHVAEAALEDERVNGQKERTRAMQIDHSMTLLPVLHRFIVKADILLETSERVTTAINNITASLISSTFRARSFPRNVNSELLGLLYQMARKAPTSKPWKKEVADAFQDLKILSTPTDLMAEGWFPVFNQWSLHEKDRIPELLSRLTPPSSAGIMFGVGASAARLEADRRTQFTVRRICLLLLSSAEDTHVAHLRLIEEKLAELFEASPASSPSSTIKAELFMLCRTLSLSVSPIYLAPLWPIINDNLQSALTSLLPNAENAQAYNNLSLLQACKLLDLLITLSPDDFQLHEWLYITDTIDAVYQPSGDWGSAALSDQIAEALGADGSGDVAGDGGALFQSSAAATQGKRRLLLGADLGIDKDDIKALPKEDFVKSVIRPFLSQLSIHAYEGVYSLEAPDVDRLRRSVLKDILDVGSMVE